MPAIPAFVLRKLYVKGSLRATASGFVLELKNLIAPGTITGLAGLSVDGQAVDLAQVALASPSGNVRLANEVAAHAPLHFPVGAAITLSVAGGALDPGAHELSIRVIVKEVGPLEIPISETVP